MKFSKWAIGLLLLSSTQMVKADWNDSCCPSPCDPCGFDVCNLNYSFHADFLYWRVCRTELFETNSETEYLNPGYEPGFRVGAFAHSCNWDLGVRYTYYYNKKSKDLSDSDKSKYKVQYDVVDIEVGYTLPVDCVCGTFRPFAGAKLAWIDEKFDDIDTGDGKLDFKGYGLYLGAEASFNICGNFSLFARGSSAILDSDFKCENGNDRKKECLYTPVFDAFVGLEYAMCDLCGLESSLLLGYEVQSWRWRDYESNDDVALLGFGGLVVRANVNF